MSISQSEGMTIRDLDKPNSLIENPETSTSQTHYGELEISISHYTYRDVKFSITQVEDLETVVDLVSNTAVMKEVAVWYSDGNGINTNRAKRAHKSALITPDIVETSAPAFLVERPPLLEEDPAPFVLSWGLRNKDTMVGSYEATAIWSQSVISRHDQMKIVEFSDDLQIVQLSAQDIASANAYQQAALHNLKIVRMEKDNCGAGCEHVQEGFGDPEKVIKEYQKSQEFQDLLDAEYDANLPDTFAACWEKVIGIIGEKISSVTLKKFPVPTRASSSKAAVSG
ncbi:hypothetical protein AgCh_000019 [Apium graveolens]